MKFSDVLNKKKYSVMVALRFDGSTQKSGVYSVSRDDLETMVERNPSYFETISLPVLCARLDKMGADSCTDAVNMVKQIVKGRHPICELDAIFL